jgi:glyoxylase-like metal-dependent hydrolase (beta-lactamase superfamily II)
MFKKVMSTVLLSTISLFGFEYNLEPKKVSDNIWCFFGELDMPTKQNGGNMSNSCYIKGKSSWILLDSGPTYKYAQQAYAAMSKIANLPVSTVLNTHEHDDHWLGNSFYKTKFNAKLIGVKAQDLDFKKGDSTRMSRLLTKDAVEGSEIVKLDQYIEHKQTIVLDGEKFELVPVGKSHSKFDVFMYMPDRKVIFAGDLVMNGRITSNRDGLVIGQLNALNTINKYDWNILVPGHGLDVSKHAIDESIEYFSLLKKRVLAAVEEDTGLEGVNKFVKMVEFKDKAMFDMLNSKNVSHAYGELEFYEAE